MYLLCSFISGNIFVVLSTINGLLAVFCAYLNNTLRRLMDLLIFTLVGGQKTMIFMKGNFISLGLILFNIQ